MPDVIDIKKINFKANGVGGQTDKLNEIIRRTFLSRTISDDEIKKLGIKHIRGILLYGPPGCGKTLIAKTIGKMLNCASTTMISGTELLNKWIGESEENVRKLFKKSKEYPNKLHLIIIDEFDSIAKSREKSQHDSGVSDRIVNEFLASIDGTQSLNNFIIIGMTNYKESIDKALLRPGRLEVHIKIDLPKKEDIIDILNIHTKNLIINKYIENINFDSLADSLVGYTGAEVEGVIKAAVSRAIDRHVENKKKGTVSVKKIDFDGAIKFDVKPMFRGIDENLVDLKNTKFIDWTMELKKIHSSIITKLKSISDGECYKIYIKGKKYSGKFTMVLDVCNRIKYECIRFISPYNLLNLPTNSDKIKHISEKFEQAQTSNFGVIIVQDFDRIIESIVNTCNPQILNTFMVLLKKQTEKNKKCIIIFTGENDTGQISDFFDKEYNLPYDIINKANFKNILKKLKMPINEKTKNISNVKELFFLKNFYINNHEIIDEEYKKDSEDESSSSDNNSDDESSSSDNNSDDESSSSDD